jgi:ubiquinone/menaquinone biosynthesis C-methylase UbiE
MTTIERTDQPATDPTTDPADVEAYMGLVGGHATFAINALLVGLGDQLGLWKAMAGAGPLTVAALAERADVDPRYLREWLSAMTASGFLVHDPVGETFALPDAGAAVLAHEDSPALFVAPFQMLPHMAAQLPSLRAGFRAGTGLSWLDRDDDFCDAEERFSRPLHRGMLVDVWLATVPGLLDELRAGARVADVGCGQGRSTIELAKRFPESSFVGFDFHDHSIAKARGTAMAEGVADRVTFEVADARSLPDEQFDVVLLCDALHDMGDPVAAARRAHEVLRPGGRIVTLDPKAAGDSLAENLGDPMAATFYAVSCFVCTPSAIAQDGPAALGALAGEAAIRQVLVDAGFADAARHGHDTPMNMVVAGTKAV